jgi:hypothetical protein
MLVLALLLGGCGTCVEVTSSYDAVWTATHDAIFDEPNTVPAETGSIRRDAGRLHAIAIRDNFSGEMHYYADISPIDADEVRERKVCIRVRQLTIEDDIDGGEKIRTVRRSDIENRVSARAARNVRTAKPPIATE